MKYMIDESDLGIEYQDEGPWRSYGITSYGDSLQELLMEATVYETDQDGGELNCYSIYDSSNEVEKAAFKVIENCIKNCNVIDLRIVK